MVKGILLVFMAITASAAEFSLGKNGLGPVIVQTDFSYEGRGERLIASAINAGSEALPLVRLCVQRKPGECFFTLWNEEPWKPGQKLEWNLATNKHAPDLGFEVTLLWMTDPRPQTEPQPERPPAINSTTGRHRIIKIEVLASELRTGMMPVYTAGVPGRSTTTCTGSTGSATCNSVSTAATGPSAVPLLMGIISVAARLPDGREIQISCRLGSLTRKCGNLTPGEYDAEIDGNSLWIVGHQLDGKPIRMKFRYFGSI